MSSMNYDHRLKLPAPIRIPLSVPFYGFYSAHCEFVRTRVFGELNSGFSVCVFSGSTRDALTY
jgi:hypothetical protein